MKRLKLNQMLMKMKHVSKKMLASLSLLNRPGGGSQKGQSQGDTLERERLKTSQTAFGSSLGSAPKDLAVLSSFI